MQAVKPDGHTLCKGLDSCQRDKKEREWVSHQLSSIDAKFGNHWLVNLFKDHCKLDYQEQV